MLLSEWYKQWKAKKIAEAREKAWQEGYQEGLRDGKQVAMLNKVYDEYHESDKDGFAKKDQ